VIEYPSRRPAGNEPRCDVSTRHDDIKRWIAEVGKIADVTTITDDSELVRDLHFDSLQAVEALSLIEERLGISIPETILFGVRTVGDILRYVDTVAGKKPASP
jgi:acyl carrier protein